MPLLSELLLINVNTKLPSLNLPFIIGIGFYAFGWIYSMKTLFESSTSFETGEESL